MKIKWNWGTGITLYILIFLIFIAWRVYKTTQNPIMLVEKDYYPKGMAYQDRIDEMKNATRFEAQFYFMNEDSQLVVQLPFIKPDTSNLYFFRPSDNNCDFQMPISPDSTFKMYIPFYKLTKGKYLIKLYWEESGKAYYIEKIYNYK